MARKLTHKQKKFVQGIIEGKTGTQAALETYDIDPSLPKLSRENNAAMIASDNLRKPKIQQVLRDAGFDEIVADNVVAEILNDRYTEPQIRLQAADKVYKRLGSYAAEKSVSLTANMSASELSDVIKDGLDKFRGLKQG